MQKEQQVGDSLQPRRQFRRCNTRRFGLRGVLWQRSPVALQDQSGMPGPACWPLQSYLAGGQWLSLEMWGDCPWLTPPPTYAQLGHQPLAERPRWCALQLPRRFHRTCGPTVQKDESLRIWWRHTAAFVSREHLWVSAWHQNNWHWCSRRIA